MNQPKEIDKSNDKTEISDNTTIDNQQSNINKDDESDHIHDRFNMNADDSIPLEIEVTNPKDNQFGMDFAAHFDDLKDAE